MKFDTWDKPNWCPGCGNYGILAAVKQALLELNLEPNQVAITGGIGCSSKLPQWVRANAFCGLHGRPVALAVGIKLAKPDLVVIADGGDGDGYGEGTNHFIHLCKNNVDITYLVHDNKVYSLTKGQTSPTSDKGFISKTTPWGAQRPLNPIAVAIAAGATFVARGFAGDIPNLKEIIKQAILHKGASIVDILQPCVVFNHVNTYDWYRDRIYYLKKPFKTREQAYKRSLEWGDKIPLGVFYKEDFQTLNDLVPRPGKVKKRNISKLLKDLE